MEMYVIGKSIQALILIISLIVLGKKIKNEGD